MGTEKDSKTSTKKVISADAFCNVNKVHRYTRFYLKKVYKNKLFTESEWKNKIK